VPLAQAGPEELSVAEQVIFQQAQAALNQKDLDGGIELLLKLLARDPNHVEARRYLRATALRRLELGRAKPNAVSTLLTTGLAKLLGLLGLGKTIGLCDRYLTRDPAHVVIRDTLAAVLAKRGYSEGAICEYEAVHDIEPQRKEMLRSLGRLYKAKEEIVIALQRYEELRQLDPHDPEATRETQQLAAQGAIISAGWEDSTSYRDVVKDVAEAERLEDERAVSRTAADLDGVIARQQGLVKREPTIAVHYIRLGDLLRQASRYDEAEQVYLKAKEINPMSFDAVERLGDTKQERLQQEIQQVKAEVGAKPEDQALKQKLEELTKRHLRVGIEDLTSRVQAHPTDTGIRTRLGRMLYEAGEYDKAIAEFQQAQDDPRHRLRALSYMGLCFMKKGMYELAVRRYEEALSRVEGFTETTKELVYNLGLAYEQMGKKAEAKAQYEKIYERDITFRDVARKLESLYKEVQAGQSPSGSQGS